MKVLLINDSSSNPNWGDRAAAVALKQMIVARGSTISSVITEAELREGIYFRKTVSKTDPPETQGRNVGYWLALLLPPAVVKLYGKLTTRITRHDDHAVPITADDFESKAQQILQHRHDFSGLVNAIEAADIVVIHGDGCMVGNGLLPRSELFIAYLIKRHFPRPVILINHTADFSNSELSRMAELVYPGLDDVTYRDETSERLCRDRWPGRYAADTAFQFHPAAKSEWVELAARPTYFDMWPDQAAFDPRAPYICVGGSSIYSFPEKGAPTKVIQDFVALVKHLRGAYSGQIVLTASDRKDQVIFRAVAAELSLPLLGLNTPIQQAVDVVGNAQAYIGGRWHVAIFALSGGTPVIPLSSKTFKIDALVAMSGLRTETFDAHNLPAEREKIANLLTGYIAQGDPLRTQLYSWAQQQAICSWDNLAYLTLNSKQAGADQ